MDFQFHGMIWNLFYIFVYLFIHYGSLGILSPSFACPPTSFFLPPSGRFPSHLPTFHHLRQGKGLASHGHHPPQARGSLLWLHTIGGVQQHVCAPHHALLTQPHSHPPPGAILPHLVHLLLPSSCLRPRLVHLPASVPLPGPPATTTSYPPREFLGSRLLSPFSFH